MSRRSIAVLVLVSLVALSGCAGLLGPDVSPTPGPNTTATPQTPTGTGHQLPLNGTAVLDAHQSALEHAGSFRYQVNATKRFHNTTIPPISTNKTVRRNDSSGATWSVVLNSLGPSRETYLDGDGNAYQVRQRNASHIVYGTTGTNAINFSTLYRPPIGRYLAGLNFSYQGTTTIDGHTVDTYTVHNMSQVDRSNHGLEEISTANLDSLDVTLRIDRDGLVRSFEYRAVGSNRQGDTVGFSLSLRYTDVGSTTVPRPTWVDRAASGQ
ncbi:MAG: hypothetical protein ABEI77_08545 [Halorientalis sp.]